MQVYTTNATLQQALAGNTGRVAFVPTMGNLHEGHLDLVRAAKGLAQRTVVSIFINPLQFGGSNDYDKYPRTLDRDCECLRPLDVDIVYAPGVTDIYPRPAEQMTQVHVPDWSDKLCGAYRPGHFSGVTTVVAKLFNIVKPDIALFGEKDYQQLQIIRRMVADLNMSVEIHAVPTRRESSGLAMSSRNQYLSPDQREVAATLYRVLCDVKQQIESGHRDYAQLEQQAGAALNAAGFKPEYVSILDPEDFAPPSSASAHVRVFAAAWLGQARLIDNIEIY